MQTKLLLEQWLEQFRDVPFSWGKWDCCTSCNSWLNMVGFNYLPGPIDYNSARGAAEYLIKHGGWETVLGRIGQPLPPLQASIGDVIEIPHRSKHFNQLGIFTGTVVATTSSNGFVYRQLEPGFLCRKVL